MVLVSFPVVYKYLLLKPHPRLLLMRAEEVGFVVSKAFRKIPSENCFLVFECFTRTNAPVSQIKQQTGSTVKLIKTNEH